MSTQFTQKNVLVLYTGGSIGMEKDHDNVYAPKPNKFIRKLRSIPEMHDNNLARKYFPGIKENQLILPQIENNFVSYTVKEYDPLLDSSNMTPQDWIKIAKDIKENYNAFDGFTILHGTDTLAYTSSALSFMIEGLQKSVILTGAQVSIFETRNDAVGNILSSLILSSRYRIPEVCIFFGKRLLRGNRSTKVSLQKLEAFDSPNYGPLAQAEVEIRLNNERILEPSSTCFQVNTDLNTNVGILTFFPTVDASMIESFLRRSWSGLIIQTYGAGNIPSNQTEIVKILKDTVDRGVLVVNITVCLQGSVSSNYDAGKVLQDIGVITGYDMTVEAALTKLSVVLGYSDLSYRDRVQLMKENMRGELTIPNDNNKGDNK